MQFGLTKFEVEFDEKQPEQIIRAIQRYMGNVQTEAFEVAKVHARTLASAFLDRIKQVIREQELPWQPLSELYLAWKKEQDLDERILIATGEYVKSIYVEEDEQEGVFSISVKLPDRAHEATGINLQLLSKCLEYGVMNEPPKAGWKVPPRPHWRPAAEGFIDDEGKVGNDMLERMTKSMEDILREQP